MGRRMHACMDVRTCGWVGRRPVSHCTGSSLRRGVHGLLRLGGQPAVLASRRARIASASKYDQLHDYGPRVQARQVAGTHGGCGIAAGRTLELGVLMAAVAAHVDGAWAAGLRAAALGMAHDARAAAAAHAAAADVAAAASA